MAVALSELHLRCNPFGELLPEERARVAVGDFEGLARVLAQPGTAIQLRGDCGRGKSSHLFGLRRALPTAQYARVDHGDGPSRGGIYLMDEADHFGVLRRWWYLRRATSVAVATHACMAGFLRRCGYRVVDVPVGAASPERVLAMAERRIALAWTGEGEPIRVSPAHAEALVQAHGDDLRAIEDALYDWVTQGAPSAEEDA